MTTTPPPLDDREKVARALWDALPDEDERGAFEDHPAREWIYRDADAVLAVLDLPARDTRTWWNGYDVGQQDATGVPANGDGTYTYALDHGPRPQEAPDAR